MGALNEAHPNQESSKVGFRGPAPAHLAQRRHSFHWKKLIQLAKRSRTPAASPSPITITLNPTPRIEPAARSRNRDHPRHQKSLPGMARQGHPHPRMSLSDSDEPRVSGVHVESCEAARRAHPRHRPRSTRLGVGITRTKSRTYRHGPVIGRPYVSPRGRGIRIPFTEAFTAGEGPAFVWKVRAPHAAADRAPHPKTRAALQCRASLQKQAPDPTCRRSQPK